MTQRPGIVPVVYGGTAGGVVLIEARLHCRAALDGLLAISMVEVSILKELNTFGAERCVCEGSTRLVSPHVL